MVFKVMRISFDAEVFRRQLAQSLGLAATEVQLDVQPINGTDVVGVSAETTATTSTTKALEQLKQLPADELR